MSMESPTGSAESSGAQRGPSASAGRLWTVQVARHRLFVAVDRNARHRRAGDVVVVVALTLMLVAAAMLDGHGDLVAKVVDMPPAVHLLAGAALAVAAAWSLFLVAAVVARLRTDLLARLGTGLVAAGLVGVPLLAHLGASNALVVLLACATAGGVLRAYVGRPYGKFGRWSIGVALALTWLVGGCDLVAAAVVVVAAELAVALVAILFGSSEGVPDARDVEHTLAKLGVEVGGLAVGAQRASGSFDLTGVDASGRIVCVRLIRRDAWGAQFVVRAWRAFWYPSAPSAGTSRFHQLEREALMVLLAEQGGVMVPEVVTVDRGPSDDALLVVRLPTGTSDLARGAQTLDDQMLDDQWRAVDRLHAAGIAHRDLCPDVWRTVEGHVLLADLGSAALSRSGDDQLLDQAQLLCTNVVQVGEERAVSAAVEHFGAEGLEKVLPYLQQAALGPDLRKASRSDALDLDQLRSVAASRAGVDVPTLAKLRRVSWSSLLSLGLLLLASFTVVSLISGIGAEQVIDEFAAANWWWFVPTLVVGQFAILAGAVPARGASPRRVAIGLLAALQMAIAFVALALPSTAARLAIILRFFERQGVPPASATTIAALDSFSGFVVQILILLAVELFGPGTVKLSLSLSLEQSGGGIGRLLALLAALLAVVVVAAVIVVALPSTRHRLQEWLRPKTREAVETLRGLRSVNRVLVLLGGNFAVQALNAITLQFAVLMFGSCIGFVPALVVFVVAALFGGLMPVPGGVGVVEAALAVGLTAVGLDAGVALAAAIAFRLATFYLPPIWGFGVFRWMQSQDFL